MQDLYSRLFEIPTKYARGSVDSFANPGRNEYVLSHIDIAECDKNLFGCK